MEKILMQFERLKKHFDAALQSYDEISMLDFTHSLRIWTELKDQLPKYYPLARSKQIFQTSSPNKSLSRSLGNRVYLLCYLPGDPVRSYANQGSALGAPESDVVGPHSFVHFSARMTCAPEYIEIRNYQVVYGKTDESESRLMSCEVTKKLNFHCWLGAEALRVNYRDKAGGLKQCSLSRENIIKQLANNYDASHTSLGKKDENHFSDAMRFAMSFSAAGLPIPYFILLKIAADMIDNLPKMGIYQMTM